MTDNYGRKIDYLRISVTDRCNLRCVYCMPENGIPEMLQHEDILTYEEIMRVVRAFSVLGLTKIKITGGEPLARKGLVGLISEMKACPGIREISLTTNGMFLPEALPPLLAAGLNGVNISLDCVEEEGFRKITRSTGVQKVMQGIKEAYASGINVKVNAVPIRELNGEELWEIALLAKDMNISVRFIELMPIGSATSFTPMTTDEVMERLSQRFGALTPYKGRLGNGPAKYYQLPGFLGKLGFISAISDRFCTSCNRVRLTPDGFLKLCLHYDQGIDLRKALRNGMDDAEFISLIADAVREKPGRHQFNEIRDAEGIEKKSMFQIGG